ncbi:TetR/AcrR family transcriptional regulator [Clostridium sp. C8-1-8]|uniref:TetR/AcrR family transcriptional regulator n=1 Tax=Clostridium sp. C8-1-8 TaxID=2698831 RepID=UPI0013714D9B|nr:TetR/AcrR family transcriptional regulator [Clostridium sp. C8-1-8]
MEKKMGRPRSEKTKQAILTAAYELLLENGFGSVTIEKIAERAGVSKATIYKWWSNKGAVVMDAFFDAAVVRLPIPDTGSTLNDMIIQVNNLSKFLTSKEGKAINEIIAEGQFDPKLAEAYRNTYFKPRRLDSRYILERGISRGELSKDLDIELAMDLMFAPLFYRLLITGDAVNEEFIGHTIKSVFEGIK